VRATLHTEHKGKQLLRDLSAHITSATISGVASDAGLL
jgi:hypothetical protein